jgi:drug/metabolite transporter (DMT)-like permease
MFKHPRLSWLPFYMLVPLGAVLLFLDDQGQMSSAWRMVLLGATASLICALALIWVERHPRLVEGERPDIHTYRVVSYPWSVFQCPSSGTEDEGASEDESARHEGIGGRHVRYS